MIKFNFEMKTILLFALPLIFSNLINAASSLISMYLLSQVSTDALAAGAIITSTYGFIVMMVISMLYSVSIMIGKQYGAGQHHEIGRIVFAGILITMVIGIPLTILLLHMDTMFEMLGQPHLVSMLAGEYFRGLAIGFIPSLIGAVYLQLFMGTSQSRVILYITTFGVIINSVLSYACIFGHGHIPAMGVYGAGFATSVTAYILLGITITVTLTSARFTSHQLFNSQAVTLKYISTLLKIGIPISVQYSAELLAFSMLTYMMGMIGVDALDAQQIALQYSMIGIMVVMAISQSGSVLISQSLGQNNSQRVNAIANSALLLGVLVMLMIGIVYWFFPIRLISLYLDINNPALDTTVNLTKLILSIAAFTQLFDSGRNIAAGLLRGYGDTKSSMWTGIVSCWMIGIPAAIIFGFLMHLGAPGVRLGMLLGISVGCINLVYRFYKRASYKSDNLVYAR